MFLFEKSAYKIIFVRDLTYQYSLHGKALDLKYEKIENDNTICNDKRTVTRPFELLYY